VNGLTVLIGDGRGNFTMMKGSPFEAGKVPNRVAVGDVNGDRMKDVVVSDSDGNNITLWIMRKNGGVATRSQITVGNHPKGIAIADLNGDGKGDIVVCNNADNDISIIMSK
jgi:DNA-binding beta-propeller fold protein YncE